ncbi:MAG: PKD domain-containing protein, partial [Flavobacteriales bacterium]|nr:PKD domain-containing protein [Flavobacteriales bacterium]
TAVTGRFDDGTPENPPIAGAITMERKLAEKFDSAYWRMVASPMDTTTLSQWNDDAYITGFTGSDDPGLSFLSLTTWQENACAYVGSGSINFGLSHNNGADQSGWFIYENHDTVLDLTGTLRYNFTNLVNITGLTNSGCGADPGFHLLGNPYAAHIYWDSVALSDITGGAAYVLKNDKSGNYVTYDQSTRDGNEKISSGEAFFVHTTGGAGDLTIRERHKTLSATTDSFNAVRAYIPNADPVLTIEMEANNSGFIDETRIRLKDGSSVGFDSNYEIIKLWNFDNDLNIATMLDTNELFSNSVPFDASNLRIPILLKRGYGAYNTTDSYELTFNNVEELLAYNKCIMLEDSVNGTMTPISSNGQVVNVTMMDNAPIRFFLHINSPLTMTETSPMCADDNNGASFVTGLGAGPFDYLWKNENGDTLKYSNGVSGTDSLIGLGTGIYTVEVNGNSSCNNVTSTFEIVPSVDLQTPAAVADANCYGNADGSLTINASGGSGSYMYAWSNSMTTATINNLNAGTYFVTVTDISSGCFIVDDYTISQPNEIILNKTLIHNQCFGTQNGALAVSASGNGNTYSYMWNNGSTTTQLNGLTAGDYIVTVTASSNGCQKIDTLTINSPAAIAPNVSIQNVSCHGELDGAINLNIQGGTAPYSVQWSNGMSVTNLASVGAGTFSAQIVDANGCVHSESNLTITQPAKVEADFESSLGDTVLVNQTINFTNNSSGSSTYNWNFGDGNTDIAQDPFHSYVTPGNYTVSLVAANGICTDSTANAIVVMMATSITDDFGDEAITVFHDGNMINVNFDFKSQQNVHVNIYNVIGQMMDTKTFNVMKSQESFNVPSNGVYLLEFNYGNETLTKKVRN